MANGSVAVSQTMKAISVAGTGVTGKLNFLGAMTRLSRVTIATAIAKGKLYANPQVRRCGFMTLSHVHSATPMNGSNNAKGISPAMNSVRAMSRILLISRLRHHQ